MPADDVAAADARRLNDDLAGATQAYRRALTLDPAYEYCTNWLIDLALEKGHVAEAAEHVEAALAHGPSSFLLGRRVQILCKRNDRPAALAAFAELPAARQDNDWPTRAAIEALRNAGLEGDATAAVRKAAVVPGRETVCERRVDLCAAKRLWKPCEELLDRADPAGRRAGLQQLLRALAERGEAKRVQELVDRRRREPAEDPISWGVVGYALCVLPGCRTDGIEWMKDWRTRKGVEPWMLVNLANAYEALDRMREAKEVREQGIAIDAHGRVPDHRVYLALHEWAAGDPSRAAALIAGIDDAQLTRDTRAAPEIVRAAELLAEPTANPGFAGISLIRAFQRALKPHAEAIANDPALQKFRKRTLVRLLKQRGHTWTAALAASW